MSNVCVLLAEGFEEIEAVTIIDLLRRAEVDVDVLGVSGLHVEGAHGLKLEADSALAERAGTDWEMVILPGGMPGSENLRDDPAVQALVASQNEKGRKVAAICAAPIALASAGVLDGRKATSYPGFGEALTGADYREDRVVVDGNVFTSRGPGTAMEFALRLVEDLKGPATAAELAGQLLYQPAGS